MVSIRQFRKVDFFPVTRLIYEVFPERYNPQLIINLFELFPNGLIVAEYNNNIIGFLAGVISSQNTAKILLLGVKEPHRRKGVGSLLIRSFLKNMALKGIKKVELEVEVDNSEAISFYRKHGFGIIKTIKNFYQDGKDAYVMVKYL